jgi:ACS family hexuronate transporter-like MFS transporter
MSDKSTWQDSFPRLILLLLFAGSIVNYLDRSLLSVVMPNVRRDLALSNANYALAIHAFLVMYAIFYILGGRIADRMGYRRTFTLAVVFWSLASMAHTFLQGLRSLFACQALLGMGEGIYYPSAMRGAAGWFPPASRAKAVGLILSAISLGTLITPPLVAWTTLHYGWRATFLLLGALGLLLVPPWLWVHRQIQRTGVRPDPALVEGRTSLAASEQEVTLGEFLKTRKYWCMLAARGCSDAAWYFYLFWIPGYFQEARGLSLAVVGKILWVPYFCSFLGALAGAAASSALIRRGFSLHRSRLTALLISASMAAFSASAGFAPGTTQALTLVSLALFAHQSWSTNIHTVITEISPPKHVAILYGMTGAAGTFVGAGVQLILGPLIDLHGYKPAFVWAGGMYVLAAGLLMSAGALEPIRRSVGGLLGPTRVSPPTH